MRWPPGERRGRSNRRRSHALRRRARQLRTGRRRVRAGPRPRDGQRGVLRLSRTGAPRSGRGRADRRGAGGPEGAPRRRAGRRGPGRVAGAAGAAPPLWAPAAGRSGPRRDRRRASRGAGRSRLRRPLLDALLFVAQGYRCAPHLLDRPRRTVPAPRLALAPAGARRHVGGTDRRPASAIVGRTGRRQDGLLPGPRGKPDERTGSRGAEGRRAPGRRRPLSRQAHRQHGSAVIGRPSGDRAPANVRADAPALSWREPLAPVDRGVAAGLLRSGEPPRRSRVRGRASGAPGLG